MTTSTTKTEYNIRKLFAAQFTITAEQKLFDFCTSEIGILLSEQLNSLSNAAVIGNPVRLIQLDSSSNLHTNKLLKGTVSALAQNCSGKYLAMSTGPSLSVFDLQKGAILREFHDHDGPIGGMTWHRNSPWQLATVGADCTLRIWDLRSHPAQIALRRTSKPYRRLEYSPDCNYIGCAGQMISIFDLNMTQSIVDMVCASPANNICFNPAECLLATSSEDRVIRFWDVDTGECVTQSPTFNAPIGQIFFELDGRFLAVNTRKQISCIHWEPFELFSQVSYPVQMKIPALTIASLLNSSSFSQSDETTYPQINLLDLCMHGEFLHQLTVVNMDPTKIGTICLASIPIQKLEKCGLNNSVAIDEGIPVCPIAVFKGVKELDEVEDEEEVEGEAQEREDNITPESVTASTTAESMLDSLTTIQNLHHQSIPIPSHQFVKSPFTVTSNRKRPPVGKLIKCGASSAEIAFTEDISSISNSSEMKMRQKKQQRQSDSNSTPEFKDGCSARPNRLLIIQQVQQQPSTLNSEQGSSNSSSSENRKTLIRRGNSLNNVNDITTNDNMPISSIAMANAKNRSRSQAQHNRFSKFSMSNSSTSSNASSTISSIGDNVGRLRKTLQNVNSSIDVEEELEEFTNFDPKVRSIINKQNKEINALSASLSTIRGNITEWMVEQTTRYEEPHIFAQLLNDYMRKPKAYTMGLNAAFLNRVHVLIGHRNNNYVQLGIDFIDMVTTRFGDCIQHGLASQEYTIGVDVAAEQRFERCTKSKNALFQIRLNTAFNMERMDPAQRTRFNKEILPRIDNIIDSKGFKQPPASFNERANQSSFN